MSQEQRITFNAYLFNPVFWHIWAALRNPRIRKILVRGGSSGGKTFSVCDALSVYQLGQICNVLAFRKQRVHVETTIKKSFETSIKRMEELRDFYNCMDREVRVATGSVTTYGGIDDPEKVKGIESYDIVYTNELNQFEANEWEELNRRLRGRPNQKLIADWNPIIKTHWINKEILDESEGWIDLPLDLPDYEEQYGAVTALTAGYAFKKINLAGDTLWINVTYRDNFWIVGHPASRPADISLDDLERENIGQIPELVPAADGQVYGFMDKATLANFAKMRRRKPNDYRVYGRGEDGLMRTGGEFWSSFEEETHVQERQYDPNYAIHVTIDSNVYPYITIGIWQVVKREIRQIHEIPAEEPNNSTAKAAALLDKWLYKINHGLTVFLYGDPSLNAKNTIDDDNRSFFDKFKQILEVAGWKIIDQIGRKAPPVARSGEFVNDIYAGEIEGWKIVINSSCRVAIEDYTLVKKDPDGTMDKAKVPDPKDPTGKRKIEKYGHFSDAKRYFITTLLSQLFEQYKARRKSPRIQSVKQ